jgi:hypothetical protein
MMQLAGQPGKNTPAPGKASKAADWRQTTASLGRELLRARKIILTEGNYLFKLAKARAHKDEPHVQFQGQNALERVHLKC